MSDELPGTCCMCGGTSGIVYARTVDSHQIEAICRNCYPDKSPPQIARLIQENAKLRDLLRWRDVNVEPLPKEGSFLIVEKNRHNPRGVLMEFHWVWPFNSPSKNTTHWMPMLKLPGVE